MKKIKFKDIKKGDYIKVNNNYFPNCCYVAKTEENKIWGLWNWNNNWEEILKLKKEKKRLIPRSKGGYLTYANKNECKTPIYKLSELEVFTEVI